MKSQDNQTKKTKLFIILAVVAVFMVGAFALLLTNNNDELTTTEMREKFRCDRMSLDVLATDIYCQNPEYYYEDVKNGTVISDSDFDDPRYKEMINNNSSNN